MAVYKRQLQRIVREYRQAGEAWPASAKDMARWAIASGKYNLLPQTLEKICARDLAQAMREEIFTDSKGRRVRVKHPARVRRDSELMMFWDDIRTAPRSHMELAFQLRRKHIVGECRQVKIDVDSFNDSHPEEKPIQMILDFTRDVEELEALDKSEELDEFEDVEELVGVVA